MLIFENRQTILGLPLVFLYKNLTKHTFSE